MTGTPSPPPAVDVYLAGVVALQEVAGRLPPDGWDRTTPCSLWRARDVVAHVRCVAEDYNAFLDAIVAGHPKRLLLDEDLARHNAARLAAVGDASPAVHLAAFDASARRFADRAPGLAEAVAFTFAGRSWTVGQYFGVCAVEWHIHAWDLARSAGLSFRPRCAGSLAAAWRQGVPHIELGGDDPWRALLRASGRVPD